MGKYSEHGKKLAGHLYGDLSPEEVRQIREEISRDPDLAESHRLNEKVRDYLKAKLQLEEMRDDPDLDQAMQWAESTVGKGKNSQGRSRFRLSNRAGVNIPRRPVFYAAAIAASLALILLVKTRVSQEPGDLYYSYYQPFEASDFTQRGDADESYVHVSDAIRMYISGNYTETIRLFGQIASDPELMPEVYFFKGLSYMGLGMFENAEKELQNCINDGIRYRPEALWYLGLCKLRMEKFDEARNLLVELEYYSGLYGELARELGEKIRRVRK